MQCKKCIPTNFENTIEDLYLNIAKDQVDKINASVHEGMHTKNLLKIFVDLQNREH